mmetsp:Transcript_37505/g.110780  ORF Transcript_37505/g.110780 Transcript_37505/m.110780 type:complete len:327 (-) Transcript_37505:1163-2143(-)
MHTHHSPVAARPLARPRPRRWQLQLHLLGAWPQCLDPPQCGHLQVEHPCGGHALRLCHERRRDAAPQSSLQQLAGRGQPPEAVVRGQERAAKRVAASCHVCNLCVGDRRHTPRVQHRQREGRRARLNFLSPGCVHCSEQSGFVLFARLLHAGWAHAHAAVRRATRTASRQHAVLAAPQHDCVRTVVASGLEEPLQQLLRRAGSQQRLGFQLVGAEDVAASQQLRQLLLAWPHLRRRVGLHAQHAARRVRRRAHRRERAQRRVQRMHANVVVARLTEAARQHVKLGPQHLVQTVAGVARNAVDLRAAPVGLKHLPRARRRPLVTHQS